MLRFLRMGNKRTKLIWWALIVITVVTFVGGFIFLFGAGLDSSMSARTHGDLGVVDGSPISRAAFTNTLNEQRDAFVRQTGSDPDAEESKALETQTWRMLVTQQLLNAEARKLGLHATDREVIVSLQSQPPAILAQQPAFQTDGKFDPQKYVSALRDPSNNWSAFEEMARQQLPSRKLQDRLLASLKFSEPELKRHYRDRVEQVAITVVQITPSQANVPEPGEADEERMYQKYKSRFATGPRTQLEILQIPMRYSEEEVRVARETAQGLADRARRGEDFATLAKDYSEGPGAGRGGEVNRVFQPHEFGQELEAKMAALPVGGISDPFQDGPYWVVLKVLGRLPDPASQIPSMRIAQLAIRVRAGDASLREQMDAARKIRNRAARIGLGKAAAENGLSTSRTQPYDYNATPTELVTTPEAAEWGLGAKNGSVSHVILGPQQFVIAQVASQSPGGIPPKAEVGEALRQIAQLEARIALAKPAAQQMAQAIASGRRLEDAAKTAGATPFTVTTMSRAQPDPRLTQIPEVVGAAFGAPPGQTVGPIETLAGWFFVRVDKHLPADPSMYEQMKGQVSQDLITRRQQAFFGAWVAGLRAKAKVRDFRAENS